MSRKVKKFQMNTTSNDKLHKSIPLTRQFIMKYTKSEHQYESLLLLFFLKRQYESLFVFLISAPIKLVGHTVRTALYIYNAVTYLFYSFIIIHHWPNLPTYKHTTSQIAFSLFPFLNFHNLSALFYHISPPTDKDFKLILLIMRYIVKFLDYVFQFNPTKKLLEIFFLSVLRQTNAEEEEILYIYTPAMYLLKKKRKEKKRNQRPKAETLGGTWLWNYEIALDDLKGTIQLLER